MILPLLAALALETLPAPGAVRWESIGTEGSESVDIDPMSITREGDIATAVLRVRVGPEMMQNGIAMLVVRQAMNCRTHQIALVAGDGYATDGTTRVSSLVSPNPVYAPPPPGAAADRLHSRMCGPGIAQEEQPDGGFLPA